MGYYQVKATIDGSLIVYVYHSEFKLNRYISQMREACSRQNIKLEFAISFHQDDLEVVN